MTRKQILARDRKYSKKYKKENPEKVKLIQKLSYTKHKQKKLLYQKNKYLSDPIFRFRVLIKSSIKEALEDKNIRKIGSTFILLGYSAKELCNKLSSYLGFPCEEARACKGTIITENNNHIDHIEPVAKALTEQDIIRLNQLNNLRLICKSCNLAKGDRPAKFFT
jgi:5-methylcytosine-specific restriction endonuclease McrA